MPAMGRRLKKLKHSICERWVLGMLG